jgi:hypothetical protein
VAAILTVVFIAFAAFSVGPFYLPSAAALVLAALWPGRRKEAPAPLPLKMIGD